MGSGWVGLGAAVLGWAGDFVARLAELVEGAELILAFDMSILASCSARVNFAKWKGSTAEDMNYLANMAEDKESLANQLGSSKGSE